jgi:hypothetical protein
MRCLKFDLAEKLLKSGFTLIVLRPDMYHLSDVVSNFLHEQGYEIQSQFDTKISPDIYWHMYKIAIVHPDAADTMPTRTLVYTGSVAKVLVFREGRMKQNLDTTMCVADAFSTRYKGRQGIMTNNTLRGELVFGASVKLGLHLLGEPLIQMACDPLGAYRHKVAGNCYAKTAPQAHLSKEHQLLQYTGVGIHVPDSSELVNDICSLLTLKHLQALSA